MKARVDRDKCTGCGLCTEACPAVFELVDDIAAVRVESVPPEDQESCREAAESCPVEAIAIEE